MENEIPAILKEKGVVDKIRQILLKNQSFELSNERKISLKREF